MKKILYLLMFLFALLSCSKEGDDLAYTAWGGYNKSGTYRLVAFKPDYVVEDYFYVSMDGNPIKYEITYKHSGNDVILIEATGVYAKGKIDGDTLVMDYLYDGGIYTLKKR